MSLPRTRSTKDKATQQEAAPKPRWKTLTVHGTVDPGEIYGHTLVHHAPSESLILFGGCSPTGTFHNSVFKFNLRTQRWEVLPTTGNRPKGRHFHSAVVLDHNMYIFGGKCNGYMNDISCLNLATFEWVDLGQIDGSPPTRRYGHSMVVYNRNFYVYGGYDDFGYKCNDMYEFRPTSNKWVQVKTTGEAPERCHHSAVAHNGSMYLFGGGATNPVSASSLYEYRFGTSTWTRIPCQNKAPESRWGHSSFIHDNNLYIVGGCDNILCFKDVYRISLESLSWKKVKKFSGFDPRYFGCCLLIQSNWPKVEVISDDDIEDSSQNATATAVEGVTILHHSTAVVSNNHSHAARMTLHPALNNVQTGTTAQTVTTARHLGIPNAAAPNTATSSTTTSSAASSSNNNNNNNNSAANGSSTPPLPVVVAASTLPPVESIGLGVKVLYHGGRNIHNWAFGDVLMLSLEGEDTYNPFSTQMESLIGNPSHADISFHFPNEPDVAPIHAHKAILAIRCEPFAKMFTMGMKECTQGNIEILDTSAALFRLFLSFLYTGIVPPLEELEDNLQMLMLADKYFLAHLKVLCESKLKAFISSSNLNRIWEKAIAAHATSLQKSCVRFVIRYSDLLLTSAGKKSLPKSLLVEAKTKLAQLSASTS